MSIARKAGLTVKSNQLTAC